MRHRTPVRHLTFLTRPGCGLCAEALPRVQRAARLLRRDLEVCDINDDPQLEAEYHLRIPVVLSDEGEVLAEGAIGSWDAIKATWRA